MLGNIYRPLKWLPHLLTKSNLSKISGTKTSSKLARNTGSSIRSKQHSHVTSTFAQVSWRLRKTKLLTASVFYVAGAFKQRWNGVKINILKFILSKRQIIVNIRDNFILDLNNQHMQCASGAEVFIPTEKWCIHVFYYLSQPKGPFARVCMRILLFYLNKVVGLTMCSVTWNRFPS